MIKTSSGRKYYTEEEYNKLLNKITKYEEDTKVLGNALIEAAEEHNLCDSFDDFIDDVNNNMQAIQLPTRFSEYKVDIKLTRTQTQIVTITVSAKDDYDLDGIIENAYDYKDLVNEGNDDWEDEDTEYEIDRWDTL